MEDKPTPQPIFSEWLIEEMKQNPYFKEMIMQGAEEVDKDVYDLHQFEKKE
jgi:hypothetical protein